MKKICMNCRFCEFNILYNEYKKLNLIKKIFFMLSSKGTDLERAELHPKCFSQNVYRENLGDEYVFSENIREKIFCSNARLFDSSNQFSCCGKDGKYFEEDIED